LSSRFQLYLDPTQRAELEAILQCDNAHLCHRATILKLLHDGVSPVQVAEQVGVCVRTVYNVLRRFKARGMAGLADRSRSGRPRKATAHYRQRLEAVLRQPPHNLFKEWPEIIDPPRRWTVNSLRVYLEHETGVLTSYESLRVLLHEMNYVYAFSFRRTAGHGRIPPTGEQILAWLKLAGLSAPWHFPMWVKRPAT
jgi:transposase